MKENFILSVLFDAAAVACFNLGGEVKVMGIFGGLFFALGAIFFIVFILRLIDRIDNLSKLDNLCKKMADIESRIYRTNEVLDDINRHICDGFNGIAEYLSNK